MAYNKTRRQGIKPYDSPLSKAIYSAMLHDGLSYRRIGEIVGAGHSTVMGWVKAGSRPEPEYWPGLAALLKWNVDDLQEALGLGRGGDSEEEPPTIEEQEMLSLFRTADDYGRRLLLGAARGLRENFPDQEEAGEPRKVAEEPARYPAGQARTSDKMIFVAVLRAKLEQEYAPRLLAASGTGHAPKDRTAPERESLQMIKRLLMALMVGAALVLMGCGDEPTRASPAAAPSGPDDYTVVAKRTGDRQVGQSAIPQYLVTVVLFGMDRETQVSNDCYTRAKIGFLLPVDCR